MDDWNDDDVTCQPQLTRQKADELQSNETTHLSLSYLAPSAHQVSPNSTPSEDRADNINVSCLTPMGREQTDDSQNVVHSTTARKDVKQGSESPETKLAKMFSVFTTPKKNVLSEYVHSPYQ